MEAESNDDKIATSQRSTRLSRWIGEQVTILGEAFRQEITKATLEIYAKALIDIDQQLLAAVFQRALRECRFFPTIAELRQLAGEKQEDVLAVEVAAAWDYVGLFGGGALIFLRSTQAAGLL